MYSQSKLPQRKKKSCKNTLLNIYTSSQINLNSHRPFLWTAGITFVLSSQHSKNALLKEMNWGLNGAKQISPWQC